MAINPSTSPSLSPQEKVIEGSDIFPALAAPQPSSCLQHFPLPSSNVCSRVGVGG